MSFQVNKERARIGYIGYLDSISSLNLNLLSTHRSASSPLLALLLCFLTFVPSATGAAVRERKEPDSVSRQTPYDSSDKTG